MSLAHSTTGVSMVNLVMTGADGTGVWQDQVQLVPLGQGEDAAAFVAAIRTGLPLVNNLRVLFNEHSFNPDGSLHPKMEAFLAEAVAQGFQLTICYGEGDAQNIGIGEGRWPDLTNAEAYAALEENFADVSGAWQTMLDWMAAHPTVAAGVYGFELMNESAAYRHTIRNNGAGDGLTDTDFVALYVDHALALSQTIAAASDAAILVGGWGYNGDFLTLAETMIGGSSALDLLRAGVGADLIWSAHLYPGWMGTNAATDPASLIARLEEVYAPVAGDAVLITEINADGQVDDPASAQDYHDFYAASYEWFVGNGIGFGWYPGLQTGASHLLSINGNGTLTYRHQHSLAHALNAFSLGRNPAEAAAGSLVRASLVTAALRNESYEIAAGEATFDAATQAGFGFGYAGNDTVNGTSLTNDFLYGGQGNDLTQGFWGDDFLFGQYGADTLLGGAGVDQLFGGWGHDRLDGGTGGDHLVGGRHNDTYVVDHAADRVIEQAGEGSDLVLTSLSALTLAAHVEHLSYTGAGGFVGTGNALANELTGGVGGDRLSGLDGADTLTGGEGADTLIGGAGADRLVGGGGQDLAAYDTALAGVQADLAQVITALAAGDARGDVFDRIEGLRGSAFGDTLRGDAGDNRISGMAGNDLLSGRAGADTLVGGTGADRFLFAPGSGADRVSDFEDNIDTLLLSGLAGVTDAASALGFATQTGAHVIFDFGGGDRLTVANTTLAALADDISVL